MELVLLNSSQICDTRKKSRALNCLKLVTSPHWFCSSPFMAVSHFRCFLMRAAVLEKPMGCLMKTREWKHGAVLLSTLRVHFRDMKY